MSAWPMVAPYAAGTLWNDAAEDPRAIRFGDLVGRKRDDFRDVVGVERREGLLEGGENGAGGFENTENFRGGFDLPFPAINRLDGGDEIDASGELSFHQGCANLSRLLDVRECTKDYQYVAHADS